MFQVGKPVTGSELIGRQDEIELIKKYLMMNQSVVLIAPRRFGKTSIVLEVLKQLGEEKKYTAFIDVFACPDILTLSNQITAEVLDNEGLKAAFTKLKGSALEMMKNINLKAAIEDFEFLLGYSEKEPSEWELFQQSISFINDYAEKKGKEMICSFDEFGDITKYSKEKDIVKYLRAQIQQQDHATYIFSGSYESVMNTMFVDNKSPFYRLARVIKVGYLPFDKLYKHMLKKLNLHGITGAEKLLEDTIDFFKGHPYYSQLALQQIYLIKSIKGKLPTISNLLDELLAVESSYLEKLWHDISSNRESTFILKELSKETTGIYRKAKSKGYNASRALAKLEGEGIIYKSNKEYLFYDLLFQLWIVENIE